MIIDPEKLIPTYCESFENRQLSLSSLSSIERKFIPKQMQKRKQIISSPPSENTKLLHYLYFIRKVSKCDWLITYHFCDCFIFGSMWRNPIEHTSTKRTRYIHNTAKRETPNVQQKTFAARARLSCCCTSAGRKAKFFSACNNRRGKWMQPRLRCTWSILCGR